MIVGIDPGIHGAIALIYDKTSVYIHDMPVIDKDVNAGVLWSIFDEFAPEHVFLEYVNSFGMGRQSAFNFGQGYGVIKGVLGALKIPYSLVRPAAWKGFYGLGRDKGGSRLKASQLFPCVADQLGRVKDDGRAEAVLIGWYGAKHEHKYM